VSRFYLDAAQGFHRPAFECARALVGIERILYGSDHFFTNSSWRQRLNEFIDELDLSAEERRALLQDNARKLLPCF
jgi:predicted TIM-barrel fold metal-dependent hydrolase